MADFLSVFKCDSALELLRLDPAPPPKIGEAGGRRAVVLKMLCAIQCLCGGAALRSSALGSVRRWTAETQALSV